MKIKSNYIGAQSRQSAFDITFSPLRKNTDLVIFCHGYKGFKDWGPWDLVAEQFGAAGFDFLKFNFSHNGGTSDNPIDFPDTEAFAKNTYSKELEDIGCILKRVDEGFETEKGPAKYDRIHLIGHSRGGGIAILAAAKYAKRFDKLITWAAVSDFSDRFDFNMEKWKAEGVTHIRNSRTGQSLPHNYTFYEDFIFNRSELDIPAKARNLDLPWLIAHGQDDEAVCLSNADRLQTLNPQARLLIVKRTGHTFDGSHPWSKDSLPEKLKTLVENSIQFLKT